MNYARVFFCAVPEVYWMGSSREIDIGNFALDALAAERRINKRVNLGREQRRYTVLCQRIEEVIMHSGKFKYVRNFDEFRSALIAEQFPMQAAKPGYLSILNRVSNTTNYSRLGSNFYLPAQVGSHRQAFFDWSCQENLEQTPVVQCRLEFLKWAEQMMCGIVELQSNFFRASSAVQHINSNYENSKGIQEEAKQLTFTVESTNVKDSGLFNTGRKSYIANLLREQIQSCLRTKEPVSLAKFPSDVISEVLNEYIFVPADKVIHSTGLRLIYSDGSEPPPFPIFCLRDLSETRELSYNNKIRAALVSYRHLENDPQIDLCWFRNREVTGQGLYSEIDKFCYRETIRQLDQHREVGTQAIDMFITGLQPALIGFYRGVVQKLIDLQRKNLSRDLVITPFYFQGKLSYQQGSSWH
jgi:hypothetical protein